LKESRLLKIEYSITQTFNNTETPATIDKLKEISELIHEHFTDISTVKIINSLDSGAFGKYGVPYKITTNLFGSWVYKHLEELKREYNKNLL